MTDVVADALSDMGSGVIDHAVPNTDATKDRESGAKFIAPSIKSTRASKERETEEVEKEYRYEKPKYRKGALEKPMTDLYITISMGVMAFDPVCGQALAANAPECGKQWDQLAQRNPAVRDALMRLTQASAVGGLVIAHLPIVLAIMSHHGPANVSGLAGMLMGGSSDDSVE